MTTVAECDVCSGSHDTEQCPELGSDGIPGGETPVSRARLTLPYYLRLSESPGAPPEVTAAEDLPAKFNFGTFEATKTTKPIEMDSAFKLEIFIKDDSQPVYLDTSDENRCNWLCLVTTATSPSDQNVMAFQVAMEIIYMTTRAVVAGETLRVWYAPHYARKIWRCHRNVEFTRLYTLLQLSRGEKPKLATFPTVSMMRRSQRSLKSTQRSPNRSQRSPQAINSPTKGSNLSGEDSNSPEVITSSPNSAPTVVILDKTPSSGFRRPSDKLGVFPCVVPGCGLIFPTQLKLHLHGEDHETAAYDTEEATNQVTELLPPDSDEVIMVEEMTFSDLDPVAMETLTQLTEPVSSRILHHAGESHRCHQCSQEFPDLLTLARHVKGHLGDKMAAERKPRGRGSKRKFVTYSGGKTRKSSRLSSGRRKQDSIYIYGDAKGTRRDSFSDDGESLSGSETPYTVIEIVDADTEIGEKATDADDVKPAFSDSHTTLAQSSHQLQALTDVMVTTQQSDHVSFTASQGTVQSSSSQQIEQALPIFTSADNIQAGEVILNNGTIPPEVVEIIPAADEAADTKDGQIIQLIHPGDQTGTVTFTQNMMFVPEGLDPSAQSSVIIQIPAEDNITTSALNNTTVQNEQIQSNSILFTSDVQFSSDVQNIHVQSERPEEAIPEISGASNDPIVQSDEEPVILMIPSNQKQSPAQQHASQETVATENQQYVEMPSSSTEDSQQVMKQELAPSGENESEIQHNSNMDTSFEQIELSNTQTDEQSAEPQDVPQTPIDFDDKTNIPTIVNLNSMDVITGELLPSAESENATRNQESAKQVVDLENDSGEASLDPKTNTYRCRLCGEQRPFVGVPELEAHLLTHSGMQKCDHCDETYSDNHVCPGETRHLCRLCGRLFEKISYLKHHEKNHNNPLACVKCDLVFATKRQLKHHKPCEEQRAPSPTKNDKFSCEFCGATFSKKKYLFNHMASHTEEHKCTKCGSAFARKETLMKHWTKCRPDEVEDGSLKVFACKICPRVFGRETTYENHVRTHTAEHRCEPCNRKFVSKFSLMRHVSVCTKVDSSQREYKCEICSQTFTQQMYLARHLSSHQGKFMCSICDQYFSRKDELTKHTLECSASVQVEATGFVKCTVCGEVFKDTHAFRLHYEEHTHPYKCDQCSKLFMRYSNFNTHKSACTVTDCKFTCDICNKSFQRANMLRTHKQMHEPKRLKCERCNKAFRRFDKLNEHMCIDDNGVPRIIKHNLKKGDVVKKSNLVCPFCGKTFSSISNLNKHQLLHGEKNEECEICHKKFHLKVSLKEHVRYVHSEELLAECKVCGKRLKNRNSVYSHMKLYHSGVDTLFSCEECGKTFRSKGNLQKHLLVHSTERTFACRFCGHKFKFQEQQRKHELQHTMGLRYQCDLCDKAFLLEHEIRRHLSTAHHNTTYICVYCQKDCHHFAAMKQHLERSHAHVEDWQPDPDAFVRSLATTVISSNQPGNNRQAQPSPSPPGSQSAVRCGLCDALFSSRSGFQAHQAAVHTRGRSVQTTRAYSLLHNLGEPPELANSLLAQTLASSPAPATNDLLVPTSDDLSTPGDLAAPGDLSTHDDLVTHDDLSTHGDLSSHDLQLLLQGGGEAEIKEELIPSLEAESVEISGPGPEPVIIAEIQGMSGPSGEPQTIIIQGGSGHGLGEDGGLSTELAQTLQSLSAQGLFVGDQTMITIGGLPEGGLPDQELPDHAQLVTSDGLTEHGLGDQDLPNQLTDGLSNQIHLVSTEGELITAHTSLVSTEGQLVSAEGQLVSAEGQLVSAEGQLVSEEGQLVATEGQLISAEGQLVSAEGQLMSAPQEELMS